MKKLLTKLTLCLLLVTGFAACKKEKQEEPVAQEQATIRNQGNGITETLQRGPNGQNVIFSNWIQKTEADWAYFNGGYTRTTDMLTSSLTDVVRDKGIVLVYFNLGPNFGQLPFDGMGENLMLNYLFETGKITARFVYGGGQIYVNNFLNIKLRYVLIPSSSFNGRMSQTVDFKDYDAVCEYYGIPK